MIKDLFIANLPSFIGGLLIGAAALGLLLFNGRIAGVSGIIKNFDYKDGKELLWRTAFLVGLMGGGVVASRLWPFANAAALNAPLGKIILAGWFVGLGSAMANGCTSGHGVCGLSFKSKRSFVAVITFMATGMLTVWVSHKWGDLLWK